jgi:hypothetical protein
MIKETIQLFGFLVLAFLGIVAPFLLIILSISSEGTKELLLQYENEKKQNENNLSKLVKGKIDSDFILEIEKRIKTIKKDQKNKKEKIDNLDIKNQTLRLFVPLIISFSFVILSLIFSNILWLSIFLISIAVIIFLYSLVLLWKTLCIIKEVRVLIDDNLRDDKNRIIGLLAELKENRKTENNFLKKGTVSLNNKILILNKINIFNLCLNERNTLKYSFDNNDRTMVKNFEMGVILPSELIIDNKKDFIGSISALADNQLVRHFSEFIQGETITKWKEILITPIAIGSIKSTVYIKAENILSSNYRLELNVLKSNYENVKLKLLSAKWGSKEHTRDALEKLNLKIDENGLEAEATNDLVGDPDVGVRKKLFIHYLSFGKEYEVEIDEDHTRQLP